MAHLSEWPLLINLQDTNAGEVVEKREHSCTVGGNVNWYNHCGKLNIELPYDPESPLLGVYQDKIFIQKDTGTPKFTVAPFTIAKTWKQPKCPSTDEGIKKMWNTTQP